MERIDNREAADHAAANDHENDDDDDDDTAEMTLSDRERDVALRIKRAVEADESVDNTTDMMYAMQALFCIHDNKLVSEEDEISDDLIQDIVLRVQGLQHFRHEYGILDNLTDATETLLAFQELHPGLLLLATQCPPSMGTCCMLVLDAGLWDCKRALENDRAWRTSIAAWYYLHHATHPQFAAMRQGHIHVFDWDSVEWDQLSPQVRLCSRMGAEFNDFYPQHCQKFYMLNTPTVANVIYSAVRKFFPASVQESTRLGCDWGDIYQTGEEHPPQNQRLADLLGQAPHVILQSVQDLLTIRLHHEAMFSLE